MLARHIGGSNAAKEPLVHAALALAVAFALARYYQGFPMDDGAFFLRYAEHIAAGFGYRWNVGERAPIGASAPLWPLLEAVVVKLGVTARVASYVLAFLGLFLSSLLLTTTLRRLVGWPGAVAVTLFVASSAFILGPSMGGLETPLTIALLSAAFAALTAGFDAENTFDNCVVALLAVGLCIHKIDLVPWALGLLVAARYDVRLRAAWPSLALAAAAVVAFLLFMKSETRSFVPLSFLRKLQDSTGLDGSNFSTLPHIWFARNVFYVDGRLGITALALFALPGWFRAEPRLLAFVVIGILGQAAAYTAFPPTEPFIWYLAPSLLGMNILAAGAFLTFKPDFRFGAALVGLAALVVGFYALRQAEPSRGWFVSNSAHTEADRARAGQWVAAHTPEGFHVLTGFGNSAYYSQRAVYDSSRLNSRIDPHLGFADILAKYNPEIIILCPWRAGVAPKDYREVPTHYKLVKGFASAYESKSDDFYAVVLAREDVVDQLKPKLFEESNF